MSRSVLYPLNDAQRIAADPRGNVWLTASAGTGKTQVLAARVLRLLMRSEVKAENILCLTFTKAGAAEMAMRIQEVLASWVRAKGPALAADLQAIGEDHSPAAQDRARTLFAQVIDSPGGGLNIQTIHSFCQTLLATFPIEAGLIPGFRALEEREQASLQREALSEMLATAEREGNSGQVAKVQALSLRLGEGGATKFLFSCSRHAASLDRLTGDIGPRLRNALELPLGDIGDWLAARCGDAAVDCAGLRMIAAAGRGWGTKTGIGYAETIETWLASHPDERGRTLGVLMPAFVTQAGSLRRDYDPDKKLAEVGDAARKLSEQLGELAVMPDRVAFIDELAGAIEAGREYARAYAARKRALAVVDFDDLIAKTVELLRDGRLSDWIAYKLDRRIDHVLVDEAQDTNPDQWAIVRSLTQEYFAGQGSKADTLRTLFAVGDFKQAIFGFQGTSPYAFEGAQRRFAGLADNAGEPFRAVSLSRNYRSTPPVLAFVDALFDRVGAEVLGKIDPVVAHESAQPDMPGQVVLWPAVPAIAEDVDEGDEGWIEPGVRRLADNIALQIADWIAHGCDGQAVAPGDIMVLVRKRTDLAALLVARLYARGVAVAGVDRLRLNAPLAVQDLLAAARFALQPLDDLNLAALLVSPLLGWSQDELLEHGYRDKGVALWPHLQGNRAIANRIAPLRRILRMADLTTPYRFFEEILSGPISGRAKLLARLGNDARDPVEELLNAALQFEAGHTPSLQPFLAWFDTGGVDVKREATGHADEVRVMTVHGSKGLQSRIVVLADATVDPDNAVHGGFDWQIDEEIKVPVFAASKNLLFGPLEDAAEWAGDNDAEEHWRLLYVAMTRAEEMLFIGGALGKRAGDTPPESSWYAAIEATLAEMDCDWEDGGEPWGRVRRYCPLPYGKPSPRPRSDDGALPAIPDWAREPAPVEARPPYPLAPSALGTDQAGDPPADLSRLDAAERGRLLHGLFERLPDITPERRRAAGRAWLERHAPTRAPGDRDTMIDAVCGVIADPEYAEVFGPASLAEAPIAAVVADGIVVSGQVDRLIVASDHITIVDFKTGALVPQTASDVPIAYWRQMAAYAAALGVIFPGRPVRASLLYVAGPAMIDLIPELLADHSPSFDAGSP